jgi:nucleotide-binding universal stress UspA family protein
VAFAVSSHARCPVVVVRGDGTTVPGPDRPVVVGIDGSPAAAAALRFGARTAAETSAPLVLVGAWHPPAGDTWEAAYWVTMTPGEGAGAAAERATQDVLDRARDVARDAHPGLEVRTEAIGGSAGRVLADASKGAGLVVVGARGRGGFSGLLLGSVSHAVIHRATCPVAVVRS